VSTMVRILVDDAETFIIGNRVTSVKHGADSEFVRITVSSIA
jgi:hypothetical protein